MSEIINNDVIDDDVYRFGDTMIHKQEIAMNLATEGFRFVAFEQHWTNEFAGNLFEQLGDINSRLTDDDCQEFVRGLQNSLHDGELLYAHVTNFTRKMLQKWGIEENNS